MKKIILTAVILIFSTTSFAFTQAEALQVAFNSSAFVDSIGEDLVNSVKVTGTAYEFRVIVNEEAPLADGCSYMANIITEKFAVSPAVTGIRLVVSTVDKNCIKSVIYNLSL